MKTTLLLLLFVWSIVSAVLFVQMNKRIGASEKTILRYKYENVISVPNEKQEIDTYIITDMTPLNHPETGEIMGYLPVYHTEKEVEAAYYHIMVGLVEQQEAEDGKSK